MKYYDVFNIIGRGLVYTVDAGPYKIGDTVEFDGKEYEIRGIEQFMKMMSPPIPGDQMGLVVREKTNG